MPTFISADCPRATDVLANRVKAIVFSFPKFSTNRMDRGKIDYVEAHLVDEGQLLGGVFESPVGFAVINT